MNGAMRANATFISMLMGAVLSGSFGPRAVGQTGSRAGGDRQARQAQAQGGALASTSEHVAKANAALKAGQPDKAIPELEAVVRAEPANAEAQGNLGVLLYFGKQFAPAAEHLRAALAQQPGLSKIRGLLGMSEVALGQPEAALNDLKTALPQLQEPGFTRQVGLTVVELQTSAGDLPAAANTAQMLRTRQPTDPEILYACYRTATDLAGESLLSLSLTAPQSALMQQAIAHELLRVRDFPGAIAGFRRAIAIDPNLPGTHLELAEALRNSPVPAEREEAAKEYRAALERNSGDVLAQVRLADLLSEKGAWPEARKLYESALTANPQGEDAAVGLARVESETANDQAAVALLERVVKEDPSNILAHFRLSAEYRKLKRPEDARRELADYTKLKQVKDKLQQVYSTMKLSAPGTDGAAVTPALGKTK